MATRTATLPPGKTSDKVVRHHLSRILASKTFSQVERLKLFINFIVEETVAGRGGDLKEYVIGVQVFGKEPSFDPRTDPIVRVQARRLRTRLARYYRDEGNSDELIVDLPKGGYAPVFRTRDDAPAAKRSLTATLVGRNTVAVMPLADDSPNAQPRVLLPRSARRDRARADLDQGAARAGGSPRRHRRARPPIREEAALLITGGVRSARDRLRVTIHLVDGASGYYLWSESADRRSERSGRRTGSDRQAHRREAGAGSRTAIRCAGHAHAIRQPRRAQSLPAGPLPSQSAHRRRPAQGGRVLREGDRRGHAVLARAQRPVGRLRTARALRRARSRRRVGESGVERGVRGDARRTFGGSAHLARARQGHPGLGLQRAPSHCSCAPFN